jgi:polysaccharide export outer membrane protein
MNKNWAVSALALSALVSCTTAGPRAGDIVSSSNAVVARQAAPSIAPTKFALVEADRNVAFTWRQYENTRGAFFKDPGPGRVTVQSGDLLSISLVSINEMGFVDFTTNSVSPVSNISLPPQRVTEIGTINVPPIGRVRAQGRTVPSLESFLDDRLSEVLVDPSVVVEIVQRNGALVSVVGQVGSPGSYAYSSGDTRILDLINLAGGTSSDIPGLEVMMSRHGETKRIALSDLYNDDKLNIHVRPRDVIAVVPRNNSVVVLGATGANEEVTFNSETMPLANVLGQIGGIENRRADPKGLFIYRPTPRTLAQMLGVDTRSFPGEEILAVYRFDLTQPEAFFTVSEFEVRHGDLLYVANSRYEEVDAALDIFADAVLRPVQIAAALD